MLARNALLAIPAAALLLEGRNVGTVSHLGLPSSDEILPTLLALIGVGAALWMAREVTGAFKKGRS
jgi:hypothetical protein